MRFTTSLLAAQRRQGGVQPRGKWMRPVAGLDGPTRKFRLLVDRPDDLVAERTRCIKRLRWHLHELHPPWDPPARTLVRLKYLDAVAEQLSTLEGPVAQISAEIVAHDRQLTVRETVLEREMSAIVSRLTPTLLGLIGVGAPTAAKTADVTRFKSKNSYARHNGTAPAPVWSGSRECHRLSRTGNRQSNAAIHRIAVTQVHCHLHPGAHLDRRLTSGSSQIEALRALKRFLSDIVHHAVLADAQPAALTTCVATAA